MTFLRSACIAAFLVGLTLLPKIAHAQYYEHLMANGKEQREDDPFVFCKFGMKKSNPAWKPDGPVSPGYIPQPPFCPWPQTTGTCCVSYVCFRLWPQEDFDAYFLRVRVCPQAQSSGSWTGSGNGTQSPHSH